MAHLVFNPVAGHRHVRDFRTANRESKQGSVIVFTNTKEDAERYGNALRQQKLNSRVIHGDKLQWERNLALKEFQRGQVPILVATDVAARGLDIASIGLVVQADAPRNLDTYTHRVGRTGRAGASGTAVMLLNWKSLGIANGLLDLLHEADQSAPAWMVGMAHVSRARQLSEDQQLVGAGREQMNETSEVNDNFSGQDFRRTAVEGSYGAGRDTSYRSFDDEAYSNESLIDEKVDLIENEDEATILDSGSNFNESVDCDVEMETTLSSRSDSFRREAPSKSLVETFRRISGDKEIGNQPDERVLQSLSKKGSDQRLRFEYLGMFSFDIVSPFLMRTKDEGRRDSGMPRILMVAEKPSIAKAIADALSGQRGPRQRRGISRALPVYEFTSTDFEPLNTEDGIPTRCLITVTSVVGHIFSLGFDTHNQTRPDPADFFRLPVAKQEEGTSSKLRVVDHLRALAGDSDHLVLWLDCDPEGENIAHEVIAVTRRAIGKGGTRDIGEKRIHRARFSAITQEALVDSFSALEEPDAALSRSVDARQELDLRIGVALTRLLTWRCVGLARKRFDPSTRLVSYGPCQTPTLSLCVDRAREIEVFKAEQYWKVNVLGDILGSSRKSLPLKWRVPKEEVVVDTRNKRQRTNGGKALTVEESASFSKNSAEQVVKAASEPNAFAVVVEIQQKSESMPAPLGLNTVALLEAGSKAMGMSPKQVMTVAEKLYSAGFISYPRTETTKYDPNGFDVRSALREHSKHEAWGRSASYLLRTKYSNSGRPPLRGKDVGDHPPITPLRVANRQDVGGGAAWRVYEFVVRNFIGSLHNDLSFSRRIVSLELESVYTDQFMPNHEFQFDLVTVDSLGFADCCRWVLNDIGAAGRKDDEFSLEEGQRVPILKASVEAAKTRPPQFLQEHELIRLMDEHRIGTDASMAVHVSNIIDRGYVVLCDETGEPLRPPRPPRPGQKPHPRQIGRYMVPTALGTSLFNLFGQHIEGETSPALIAKPSIRSQMEEEVKQIALGTFDKDVCLQKNLEWFEARFQELERSLSRERLGEFSGSLCPTRNSLRFWRQLGAFEPKEKDAPNRQVSKARKKVRKGSVASANPNRRPESKGKVSARGYRSSART
jgi:DNA topoisomerase IA